MSPSCNCSGGSNDPNQPLGFLLCLLVIAYIFYFDTTSRHHLIPSQVQTQDPTDATPVTTPSTPVANANFNNATITPYDRAYYDGIKAYIHFDLADIRRTKGAVEKVDHDLREQEKRMEKKLDDFARECMQMESAMKTWREENLKALWEVKQKGERGFLTGWFKYGGPRASTTTLKEEVRNEVMKAGSGRAEGKHEVRYDDDLKKG
jgi:23S rRNA pseudoU1915 N3-methylase RlmH